MALATKSEMLADGWKLRQVNKVKCYVLNEDGYTFVGPANSAGWWTFEQTQAVVAKLGQPFKTHYSAGVLTSLEYITE